ncbi:MAG TPA: GNAT family N-acetyltransferase [Solirubrobacterales bacterium]|nr:GNAT family N-acetyltransferase [Solirubrobacterales bacterium]
MPAESPPNGIDLLPPAAVPKLRQGPAPVREVVYGIDTAVPAHERGLARRYRGRVAAAVEIAPIADEEFEELLPLIAAYQRFYETEEIDEERNRVFFRRFLAPSEDGLLLGARREGHLVGYACLYWHFSSLEVCESVLMNDLYVTEEARGQGVGRTLIEATAEVARERGVPYVEWSTAPDNRTAQRLYDSTGAERSEWFTYELRV